MTQHIHIQTQTHIFYSVTHRQASVLLCSSEILLFIYFLLQKLEYKQTDDGRIDGHFHASVKNGRVRGKKGKGEEEEIKINEFSNKTYPNHILYRS